MQTDSEDDFAKYHGKLQGKIVVLQPAREVNMLEGTVVQRWTPELLNEAESTPLIGPSASVSADTARTKSLNANEQAFFLKEGVVAELDRGIDAYVVHGDNQMSWMTQRTDGGTIFVQAGGPFDSADAGQVLPQVTLAVEHYNRIMRLMAMGIPVKVELSIATSFLDETPEQRHRRDSGHRSRE